MVRPMRKTRAPTQSQRAIGHIAALQSIATMFVMHAMVGRSTLQFKMPRLDAYLGGGDERMTVLSIALALQFVPAALAGAAILSCAWVSKERQTPSAFWGKGLFHCVFVL